MNVSIEHWENEDVLSTLTTLVAASIASGHPSLMSSRKQWADSLSYLDNLMDVAMEIHLKADKPLDVLKAEYEARQAQDASYGTGLRFGVPADGDGSKLDKNALKHIGDMDKMYQDERDAKEKLYREKRREVYAQIVAGATNINVDMREVV